MSRSLSHTVAAAVASLLSLANVVVALMLLPRGAQDLAASGDQPPYAVVVVEVVIGVLGLLAAYGVLRVQRWGIVLTLVLMILNVLVSLPGVAFGPTTSAKVSSVLGLAAAGAVIWLLLRRDSRVLARAGATA